MSFSVSLHASCVECVGLLRGVLLLLVSILSWWLPFFTVVLAKKDEGG